MRIVRNIFISALLALNILAVALMSVSAYSVFFSPTRHPSLSLPGLLFPIFLGVNLFFIVLWLFLRKRHALVSLFGCLLCANAIRHYFPLNGPCTPPADAIKVMSYNVFHYGAHGDKDWNTNDVLQYIKHSGADIVCVQEDYWGTGAGVDAELDNYPYKQHNGINKTTLGLFSKYPVLWSEVISYDSESNGSVAYYLQVGGDTVLLVNNHLESYKLSNDDKSKYSHMLHAEEQTRKDYVDLYTKMRDVASLRGGQADAVAAYVERARCRYVILCGDFNDTPVSYAHQRLASTLYDAYTTTGNGVGFTYNRNRMYVRIDHLMVSDSWEAYGATVDKRIKTSDHYPIYAFLKKRHPRD